MLLFSFLIDAHPHLRKDFSHGRLPGSSEDRIGLIRATGIGFRFDHPIQRRARPRADHEHRIVRSSELRLRRRRLWGSADGRQQRVRVQRQGIRHQRRSGTLDNARYRRHAAVRHRCTAPLLCRRAVIAVLLRRVGTLRRDGNGRDTVARVLPRTGHLHRPVRARNPTSRAHNPAPHERNSMA